MKFLQSYSFEMEGIFRLFFAAIMGGIMGLERTRKRREAGFRTYMLISIGSAMSVLVGYLLLEQTGEGDPTRIAAAALSGIGFIGAGSIIVSNANRVKGLTTAAGIWVSVAVGISAGCGYYTGCAALVIISMGITVLGNKVQALFLRRSRTLRLAIVFEGEEHILPFIQALKERGYTVKSLDISAPISSCISAVMFLHVPNKQHDEILEAMRVFPGVVLVMND